MEDFSKTDIYSNSIEKNIYFRIKRGYCLLFPDRMEIRGNTVSKKENSEGNSLAFQSRYLIYAAIGTFFFYFSYQSSIRLQNLISIIFSVLGVLFLSIAAIVRTHSKTNTIYKDKIEKIKLKKGFYFFCHPYLVVYFNSNEGKRLKRFIFLNRETKNTKGYLGEISLLLEKNGWHLKK